MKLTEEQTAIINYEAPMIAINAFAGTGKTSTLVEYARQRPDWSFLYIAYNKAMQVEAAQKFPENVQCRTLHSLAYEKIGRRFPAGKIGNNRIGDLAKALNMRENEYLIVKTANGLLSFWLNSNAIDLDSNIFNAYLLTLSIKERKQLSSIEVARHRMSLALKLWDLMLDKDDLEVKMPHDGYLKLFHISHPEFNVDCVMLDEAQDSNDVTLGIINTSSCQHKIVVGDVHQAIYQFRGSKNALADFQNLADRVFYLTNSFRFNNKIANYASQVLNYFKAERHAVIGVGERGEIRHVKKVTRNVRKGSTILARRNATLFRLAIDALEEGKKVHFAGGIAKYDLELLTAIADLDSGHAVIHPFIRRFKGVGQLANYAEEVSENDILMFAKLVKSTGGNEVKEALKELLKLDSWVLQDPIEHIPLCDYLLTTAHRSKGLEFENVTVADDFSELAQLIEDNVRDHYFSGALSAQLRSDYEQEVNLYYVAVTRAKCQLTLVDCPVSKHLSEMYNESI